MKRLLIASALLLCPWLAGCQCLCPSGSAVPMCCYPAQQPAVKSQAAPLYCPPAVSLPAYQ